MFNYQSIYNEFFPLNINKKLARHFFMKADPILYHEGIQLDHEKVRSVKPYMQKHSKQRSCRHNITINYSVH